MMRADIDLMRVQLRGEIWRMTLGLFGVVVAAMGAGAALLAAAVFAFKWYTG